MSDDQIQEVALKHQEVLFTVKHWMQTQVEWKGRTDDDFITIFIRGCDYDVELTKKTLSIYYENRKNIPRWWTNRNVNDPVLLSIIQQSLGPDSNVFETYMIYCTVMIEILMRRPSCQSNGLTWILDCRDHPWWPFYSVLSPFIQKKILNSFCWGLPFKINKLITLNNPGIAHMFLKMAKPFLPSSLINETRLLGCDWSSLSDIVPAQILPEEYGGEGGPMRLHEENWINDVLAHSELIEEDNKYGYNF